MFTVVAGMGKSDWSGKLGCLMTNQKPDQLEWMRRVDGGGAVWWLAEIGEGYMTLIHSRGERGGGQKIYKLKKKTLFCFYQ